MIRRRTFLSGTAAMAAAPVTATVPPGPEAPPFPPPPARHGSRLDMLAASVAPRLEMSCPHTGESWSGWFYGVSGAGYDGHALEQLDWFLRDWRESTCVRVCARLYWALAAASQAASRNGGSGHVAILSGFRTPATNLRLKGAARDSWHMYGRAVDIRIDGIPIRELAAFMVRIEVGGVGLYPGFVHIDSGPPRSWAGTS